MSEGACPVCAFVPSTRPAGVPWGNDACRRADMYSRLIRMAYTRLVRRGLLTCDGRRYHLTEAGHAAWYGVAA